MSNNPNLIYLAAWAKTQVSSSVLRRIESKYPSLEDAWSVPLCQIAEDAKLTPASLDLLQRTRSTIDPEANWNLLEKKGIQFIDSFGEYYPEHLKEISSPPLFLYCRGNLEALKSLHKIAIVGSRQMSTYGKRVIAKLVPPLVKAGISIVSGLAYGVDAEAHSITLQQGGTAIAVLGCSIDTMYPTSNRRLAKNIIETGGVIVSEYSIGAPALPQNFPARNRIISGLSKGTVIIEAKKGSGSLITASFANEQGRDVFAVPGSIFSDLSEGTNNLIEEGATPVSTAEPILEALHINPTKSDNMPQRQLTFTSEIEKTIYNTLKTPIHIDELVRNLQIENQKLSQILTMMELRGIIKNLGSMQYCRI